MSWTHDALGLRVAGVDGLVVPALRRNPRRAHLLVSTVLGKHLPVDPRRVLGAAADLAGLVAAELDGRAASTVVVGFAETATGLGHGVADALGAAVYLHSTRRSVPAHLEWGRFEEGHSHATDHVLAPTPGVLTPVGEAAAETPVVLVDDEISTGDTALDAIRALRQLLPAREFVVASLVDMRGEGHRRRCAERSAELGVTTRFVSLSRGEVEVPVGLVDRVAGLRGDGFTEGGPLPDGPVTGAQAVEDLVLAYPAWPAGVPESGRHAVLAAERPAIDRAVDSVVTELATTVDALRRNPRGSAAGWTGRGLVVVGHEEFMHLPTRIAAGLADRGEAVTVQSTTRSPAHVTREDGYPLRRGLRFRSPEPPGPGEPETPRHLYNVLTGDGADPADTLVVLVVDTPADTERLRAPDGLLAALASAGHPACVVVLPAVDPVRLTSARQQGLRGPGFGSYAPEEVTWLLTDLSGVGLEADVAERERRIQAGTHHYAESLPVEYQPDERYLGIFHRELHAGADRLAVAVGAVTELVLADRHPRPTLVSLARAGTPIGILMRRWARHRHSLDLDHLAVSIVRDRGIDRVALDHLCTHHDPASIVFVDGWTGKGAIARELEAALREYAAAGGPRLDPELAVLADPGSCTALHGTREDFLIASACLNSTVSGLVSRTVLNDELILPGMFHGAKFYAELADADVSGLLLDTVADRFAAVDAAVDERVAELRAADRNPTWAGWASVAEVQRRHGIRSINHVKPGVGETTRVLLRREPWKVLVRAVDSPDLEHILVLAEDRGVPVEVDPDLAYACMGLVKEVR